MWSYSLLFLLGVMALLLGDGDWVATLVIGSVNLLINLPLILVLRYNRGRILLRRRTSTQEVIERVMGSRRSDAG